MIFVASEIESGEYVVVGYTTSIFLGVGKKKINQGGGIKMMFGSILWIKCYFDILNNLYLI
jgi:hypothetical protein